MRILRHKNNFTKDTYKIGPKRFLRSKMLRTLYRGHMSRVNKL